MTCMGIAQFCQGLGSSSLGVRVFCARGLGRLVYTFGASGVRVSGYTLRIA